MTSIPAAICRIYRNNFKRLYLRNKNTFSRFFIPFLKCAWYLEHFPKKDEYPSLIISEIIDAKRRGYLEVNGVAKSHLQSDMKS